jgi:8-oxo-dGTP pyrophosphatase MutT (NUDIX family)
VTAFEVLAAGDPRLAPSSDLAVARAQLAAAVVGDGPDGRAADRHRHEVLAFARDHPDASLRTNPVGHLTGSALVVDATGTRTLLLLHRKLGRWFQPGGHADGDTNLAGVALREACEETGLAGLRVVVPAIDVDVHRVEPPAEAPHLHLDTRFLVVAAPGAVEHGNDESLALRWVVPGELDDLDPPIDASTRRLVTRGLAVAAQVLA